jgi:hypothetical protein
MAKKKNQEVATTEPKDVVKFDYGEDAGLGYEGQTAQDLTIPFLVLLQSQSKQVVGDPGEKVEGAEAGKFLKADTDDVIDGRIDVVISLFEHCFVEWIPRNQGGGLVGRHGLHDPIITEAKANAERFGEYKHPKTGNDLVETYYAFGVLAATAEPIVLAFTSMKIKPFRTWNTAINKVTYKDQQGNKRKPPRFAFLSTLSAVPDKAQGYNFFNVKLEPTKNAIDSMLDPSDPRYQAAKAVYDAYTAGNVKIDEEQQASRSSAGDDDGDGVF